MLRCQVDYNQANNIEQAQPESHSIHHLIQFWSEVYASWTIAPTMPLNTSYETETMKHHDKLIEDLHLKKQNKQKQWEFTLIENILVKLPYNGKVKSFENASTMISFQVVHVTRARSNDQGICVLGDERDQCLPTNQPLLKFVKPSKG